MDDFLHSAKNLADSLATIQVLILELALIQDILNGSGPNYDDFVDTLTLTYLAW